MSDDPKYICRTCHAHWDHHLCDDLSCPADITPSREVIFSPSLHYSGDAGRASPQMSLRPDDPDEVMVWEYPVPFMPGLPSGEDGGYPDHTPYLGFGDEGIQTTIRCGGPTIETSHQTFDSLMEWAHHVCGTSSSTTEPLEGTTT